MRWSESVTLQFVKLYLKHEILWNPDHLLYRSRSQREKAYAQIASEFKASTMKSLSVAEIKIKIRSLRTTYAQQVQKILQKSSPDNLYEPSLVWFYEMDQCLKNISTFRQPSSQPQDAEEVDSSCQIWVDTINTTNEDVKPDPLNAQSDENYDMPVEEWSETKEENQNPISHKKIKKKKMKDKRLESSDEELTMVTKTIPAEDEFEIYGKYIASQLRQMDLEKALRVQLEIQSIISAARISKINSNRDA